MGTGLEVEERPGESGPSVDDERSSSAAPVAAALAAPCDWLSAEAEPARSKGFTDAGSVVPGPDSDIIVEGQLEVESF